jgi:cytochrome c oxidase cbb3-type subunit 2
MAFNIHTSLRGIILIPALAYVVLVVVSAVLPAMDMNRRQEAIERPIEHSMVARGRTVYGSYNCVTCHTQQVRGNERLRVVVDGEEFVPVTAADARFGMDVAGRAEEYAWQSPVLMGTQRTGPDLLGVGSRLPGPQWHYWHLYRPRSVSPDSIMPPHRFLFTKEPPPSGEELEYEEVVRIEGLGLAPGERLWATPDARALVEYLLSLTRPAVAEGR